MADDSDTAGDDGRAAAGGGSGVIGSVTSVGGSGELPLTSGDDNNHESYQHAFRYDYHDRYGYDYRYDTATDVAAAAATIDDVIAAAAAADESVVNDADKGHDDVNCWYRYRYLLNNDDDDEADDDDDDSHGGDDDEGDEDEDDDGDDDDDVDGDTLIASHHRYRYGRHAGSVGGGGAHCSTAGQKRGRPVASTGTGGRQSKLQALAAMVAANKDLIEVGTSERGKKVAAEAAEASAQTGTIAQAVREVKEKLDKFAAAATSGLPITQRHSVGRAARSKGKAVAASPAYEVPVRRQAALAAMCSASGLQTTDGPSGVAELTRADVAALALELARVPRGERKEVDNERDSTAGCPKTQKLVNTYAAALVRIFHPGSLLATEIHMTTELDGEYYSVIADYGLLPYPEEHGNVTSLLISGEGKPNLSVGPAAVELPMPVAKGIAQGRQQLAVSLAHLIAVQSPAPTELPRGRLVRYGVLSDGFNVYILCLEVVDNGDGLPQLVFSWLGPLRLWSQQLMDYAAGNADAEEPAAAHCYDPNAPGLVALIKLLRLDRAELGDTAFALPPAFVSTSITVPPSETWTLVGRGGGSNVYVTTDASGHFTVLKLARHPGYAVEGLNSEVAAYRKLAGSRCAAIPELLAFTTTYDGKCVDALALRPHGGVATTVPVEPKLAAPHDRVVVALVAMWGALVALRCAHAAHVSHGDLHGGNIVWIAGSPLPTAADVARAIHFAEGKRTAGPGMAAAMTVLLPATQLVDWGAARVGATNYLPKDDMQQLHTRLLPSLLNDGLARVTGATTTRSTAESVAVHGRYERGVEGLLPYLRGTDAERRKHLDSLQGADTVAEAALPVLRLLRLALQNPGGAAPAAAAGGGAGSGGGAAAAAAATTGGGGIGTGTAVAAAAPPADDDDTSSGDEGWSL